MGTTEKILEYLREEAELEQPETLHGSTSLFRGRILSSNDFTALILFLEDTFEIRVKPMDISLDNFDTADAIAGFVHRKLGHGA